MPSLTIDGYSIRTQVKAWFESSFGQVPYEIRLDIGDERTYYQTVSPAEAQQVLSTDVRVDRSLYRRNHFDCEDFAIASRSAISHAALGKASLTRNAPPAFGLLFAKSHATNIAIDHDGRPYIFDWYYNVVWQDDLKTILQDRIGGGWLSPRSVRYILI